MILALLLAAVVGAAEPLPFDPRAALQGFVDAAYGKGFRHLGDRRDFDHGHVLYDGEGRARAVLYHTQELARYERGEYGYLDKGGRNWLQWLEDGRVENAGAYKRDASPVTPELRAFERSFTITHKMLDPEKLGFTVARSRQWVFARSGCAEGALSLDVAGKTVCVVLQ